MEFKIGSLYKFAIEENKFDLSNGDLVQVIGITDSGVRFIKHRNHNGSPFCWSTNLFEQDFIEFRTIDQGAPTVQKNLITAGEILKKAFENARNSSFSMRSAGPNRAERRRKKSK